MWNSAMVNITLWAGASTIRTCKSTPSKHQFKHHHHNFPIYMYIQYIHIYYIELLIFVCIICSNNLFTPALTLSSLGNTLALLGSWWKLTTGDSVQALFAESTAVVVWKKKLCQLRICQGFTKEFHMDVVFLPDSHQLKLCFFHVFCPSDLFKSLEVK